MLSREERFAKIEEITRRTVEDMERVLCERGLCNIDRPCGLGKTRLFCDWLIKYPVKALYFYKTDDIKQNVKSYLNGREVTFLSYQKFFRMSYEQAVEYLVKHEIQVMIFDESHKVGARTIKAKWEPLVDWCSKHGVWIVGATGTGIRSDKINVTEDLFKDCGVYPYGYYEALSDGLLIEPEYFSADVTPIESEALSEEDKKTIFEADNPQDIVKYALDKMHTDTNYLKFIAFFSSIAEVEDNISYWYNCFHGLFPNHRVNVIPVTSSKAHAENVAHARDYVERPNNIDIFMCVDMMNEGVHFEDLTGIIMCRKTGSMEVFTQQVGRCMSVASEKVMMVIDMVGNLEEQAHTGNPIAEYIARKSGRPVDVHTSHKKKEHSRVHMSPKQQAKQALKNKLIAGESSKSQDIKTCIAVYKLHPEYDLTKVCNKLNVKLSRVLLTAYYYGILRKEDEVPLVDEYDDVNFEWRLESKYMESHTR